MSTAFGADPLCVRLKAHERAAWYEGLMEETQWETKRRRARRPEREMLPRAASLSACLAVADGWLRIVLTTGTGASAPPLKAAATHVASHGFGVAPLFSASALPCRTAAVAKLF